MTKQTLAALKKSIAHWKRHATGKAEPGEGIHSSYCALCSVHVKLYDEHGLPCCGCPVRKKVGLPNCKGTPWGAAARAFNYRNATSYEFKSAAAKMVTFLQSLLPKEPKPKQ